MAKTENTLSREEMTAYINALIMPQSTREKFIDLVERSPITIFPGLYQYLQNFVSIQTQLVHQGVSANPIKAKQLKTKMGKDIRRAHSQHIENQNAISAENQLLQSLDEI